MIQMGFQFPILSNYIVNWKMNKIFENLKKNVWKYFTDPGDWDKEVTYSRANVL